MQPPKQPNPRLKILRDDAERTVLQPFRAHGWSAAIDHEYENRDSLVIAAQNGTRIVRIGVLYSTATDNVHYRELERTVDRIFFHGAPYMLESFASGVHVPIEPLADFFSYLVGLNKEIEPDRSPAARRSPKLPLMHVASSDVAVVRRSALGRLANADIRSRYGCTGQMAKPVGCGP